MAKFLKRSFIVLLLLALIGGTWGYYHGLRFDNFGTWFSELFYGEKSNEVDSVHFTENLNDSHHNSPHENSDENTDSLNQNLVPDLQKEPSNPYRKIDKHARACPDSVKNDLAALAAYLESGCTTQLQKARSIYVWLTDNIAYDDKGYNANDFGDCMPLVVLKNKRSVCEGYARLFLTLGLRMGLDIKKITGYSKGYSYSIGDSFKGSNHAWNIIRIGGKWRVFDATWGTGSGENKGGKLVSTKKFDGYWFNVNPYEAIFSHLPENSAEAFVSPALDLKTYEKLPYINSSFFELGFDGETTYKEALNNPDVAFVESWSLDTYIEVGKVPKYKSLQAGKGYEFELYVPQGLSVALVDRGNKWTYFETEKGTFKLNYTPTKSGELSINVKWNKGKKTYLTVLRYSVKSGSS